MKTLFKLNFLLVATLITILTIACSKEAIESRIPSSGGADPYPADQVILSILQEQGFADIEASFAEPDLVNPTTELHFQAELDLQAESLYDQEGNHIGTKFFAIGKGMDEKGNEVVVSFATGIDENTMSRWGTMVVNCPGKYFARLKQYRTDEVTPGSIDYLLTSGFYSVITKGSLAGKGIAGVRYGSFVEPLVKLEEIVDQKEDHKIKIEFQSYVQ